MYGAGYTLELEKLKGKTNDLNHDLTFSAHTINRNQYSIWWNYFSLVDFSWRYECFVQLYVLDFELVVFDQLFLT